MCIRDSPKTVSKNNVLKIAAFSLAHHLEGNSVDPAIQGDTATILPCFQISPKPIDAVLQHAIQVALRPPR
eukprot:3010924-Pyramimonas_sp.AAC.1